MWVITGISPELYNVKGDYIRIPFFSHRPSGPAIVVALQTFANGSMASFRQV